MVALLDAERQFECGNVLLSRGQPSGAIIAFQRCLAVLPDHAPSLYNLGNALLRDRRPAEAAESFVACLRIAPEFGAAYVNLANTLRGLALLDQARTMAELGMLHLPDTAEAMLCLANVLHDSTEYGEAATLYRRVLADLPDHAGALGNLANTLRATGETDAALALCDRAVIAAPDDAELRFARAACLLATGDFASGWDEYEWRWRREGVAPRDIGRQWQGEDIAGRTILLHAEQGLGDTLQFARYASMVAARGARVVLEVQPPLLRLLRTLPGLAGVVARGEILPAFDAHCPLLSLPRAFGTRLDCIPAALPYLRADPEAADAWRRRLPTGRLRVGLAWAGSPHTDDAGAHVIDRRRSLCPADLRRWLGSRAFNSSACNCMASVTPCRSICSAR